MVLFAMTALAALATQFLHFSDFQIEPQPNGDDLGSFPGQDVTRVIVCIPLFLLACFVLYSARFPGRQKVWALGTIAIAIGSFVHLLISS